MIAIFPEIVRVASKEDVEFLAVLVRKYFAGEKATSPKLDIATIYKNMGIWLEKKFLDDQGVIIVKDEKGLFSISAIVQPDINGPEERFLLAHLLGHYFLDIQPYLARGDWSASGFRETRSALSRYTFGHLSANSRDRRSSGETGEEKKELLADEFAAALLMPKGMTKKAFQKLNDIEKLAIFFGVAEPCLERRLECLGMISKGQKAPEETRQTAFGKAALSPEAAFKEELLKTTKMTQESTMLSTKLDAIEAQQVQVPRAFAASSYRQARGPTLERSSESVKTTQATPLPQPQETKDKPLETAPKNTELKGLSRIREIAARLDKSSGKSVKDHEQK